MQQQERGVRGVTADDVFIGNGVSELIDLTLRALLAADEEVLVPSPDYPLWTAAVNLNRGRAVHYPCRPERGFVPDPDEIESLITKRTRAIVVINPNNPDRRRLSAGGARGDRAHRGEAPPGGVRRRDLRPDDVRRRGVRRRWRRWSQHTLCCTLSGLSKVYRACGYRVGWAVFSGDLRATPGSTCPRSNCCQLTATLQQRPRAVGRADGARRLPECPGTGDARVGACIESRQAIVDAVAREPLSDARGRRAVRCTPSSASTHERSAGFRRPAVRAGPAGAQARAGRARHQFQRAVPQPFPRH